MAVVGAAILAALAAAWQWNRPEMLAARWQARLAESPDTEIEGELRRIAALGDAGVPVLARGIGSPREALQTAARSALLDELTRWELLPAARAKANLAILAGTLSSAAPSFDPPTRRFAAELAMRILHWPHEDGDADRPALLAQCEAVLAAAAHGRDADSFTTESSQALSKPGVTGDASDTLGNLPRLPGGGLPVEMANLQSPREAVSPYDREPSMLPTTTDAKPLDDSARSGSSDLTDRTAAANQPRRLANAGDSSARVATAQNGDIASLGVPRWPAGTCLSAIRLCEVVRGLDAGDPQIAATAQAELQQRGITGPLVAMARRLADRDPAVRLDFTESLPTLAGIDARVWLLELSYDEDPRVRAAAVTLMATSGDIELLKRVQQVALDDPDDHTRAQAEKALPRGKKR
jgi:hypothetical protein